jgi:hypothetical protein
LDATAVWPPLSVTHTVTTSVQMLEVKVRFTYHVPYCASVLDWQLELVAPKHTYSVHTYEVTEPVHGSFAVIRHPERGTSEGSTRTRG